MMEVIHNLKKRMPVILNPYGERIWLDISSDPAKEGLFLPFDQELMKAEKV